jgi:hypothetical protein
VTVRSFQDNFETICSFKKTKIHMSCVHGTVASIYYQISYGGTSLLPLYN